MKNLNMSLAKKIIAKILCFILVMCGLFIWQGKAGAASDITPPTVNSVSISKNIGSSGDVLTVTVNAQDDISGIKGSPMIMFDQPGGNTIKSAFLYPNSDGTYSGNISIGANDAAGMWKVRCIELTDNAGNSTFVYNSETYQTMPNHQDLSKGDFQVQGTITDVTPPTVNSVSISKNIGSSGDVLKVTVNAQDDISGIKGSLMIMFDQPGGNTIKSAFLYPNSDGTYSGNISIGANDAAEMWKVRCIELTDNAGNSTFVYNSETYRTMPNNQDLSKGDFQVQGTTTDVTPPTVNSVSISKNIGSTGDVLKVTVNVQDDISGIKGSPMIMFDQPGGNTIKSAFLYPNSDGTYSGDISIGANDALGMWKVRCIALTDNAGNSTFVYNSETYRTMPNNIDLSMGDFLVNSIENISIVTLPTKTNYIQGQNLDVTGAKITATYNDGSTQTVDVTPSMVSGYNANQVGTQSITVTYNGQTTTFTVNVIAKAVTGITMSSQPTKTSYIQGQDLDVTGAKIIATYNDGSNQTVDVTPSMVSGYNTNQVGTQPITVTYNGQTTTFKVTVIVTYVVSINKNDGSRITSQVLKAGTKVQIPTNPIRAGYIFNGWFTKASGGTRVAFPYTVTGNVTFFAQWTSFAGITPSGIKVTATNYNTVQLSWNAVTRATSYKVYRATTATGKPVLVAEVKSTSYKNTSLNTGTTYYYKIVACQTVGSIITNSKYSAVVSAKPTLSTPTGIKVVKDSTTSTKVTWKATSGAGGYTVYYSTSATGKFTAVNLTKTSYTKTGLTKGKTYYFKVRAYRMAGSTKVYSGSSTTVSVKM